jgi:hypothetical protein
MQGISTAQYSLVFGLVTHGMTCDILLGFLLAPG